MDSEGTGGEGAARRARLALLEQVVLQLRRTPEEEESNVTHDDPLVDPELIIREEDCVNHKMDEGNSDPKHVALAKQEELRKFEKLKVYEIVKEEAEERKCVGVMDVKSAFFFGSCSTTHFHRGSHRRRLKGAIWMVCWQNWWNFCAGHVMLH